MAVYYFDTSALVKRYIAETGTSWVMNIVEPAYNNELYTVLLTGPEVIAALFRRVRAGTISLDDAVRVTTNFKADWSSQYRIVTVGNTVISRAMMLAKQHGLRGYDAVHLAAALEVQDARTVQNLSVMTFVSADNEQLRAAQAEGLLIENPNNY